VGLTDLKGSRWNRYRIWKPLGLLALAALTPSEWEITIFDENVRTPDYASLPRPDLVGVTAFTSQANRAYQIAAEFRDRGVPVVMGGIHATMCPEEAQERVDSVVTGEAEPSGGKFWPTRGTARCGPFTKVRVRRWTECRQPGTTCSLAIMPSAQSRLPGAVHSIAASAA
jgi:hypothetical protein